MTTILLVYGIGKRCFRESIGLLSAATFAIWPTSVFYSNQLASEPLFTFLLSWYILLTLQFAERPTTTSATGAGVVFGLAILTRANAVFMVPLSCLWAWWQFHRRWRILVLSLLIPLTAMTTMLPRVIRNAIVFHKFLPFGTGGGDVLLGGNNRVVATDPVYYGYWVFPTVSLPEYREQLKAPNDELIRDSLEKKLAMRWLSDNPGWWYLLEAKFRRSLTHRCWKPQLPACTELVWAHRGDRYWHCPRWPLSPRGSNFSR